MNINLKTLANPYYMFSIVWSLCVVFYSFGWARIYPVLSFSLLSFTLITIIANVFFGRVFQTISKRYAIYNDKVFNVKNLVLFNSFLWFLNFAYSGIPLISILTGGDFNHAESYGIPTVIVFVISFTGFLCLLSFYYYLKQKKRIYLFYFFLNVGFYILVYSRGILMMTMLSTFILWLFVQTKPISLKIIGIIALSVLFILYIFGVAGNKRVSSEFKNTSAYNEDNANGLILNIADASPAFKNSLVPDEYMWGYLYLTSPMGNLQENINNARINISFDSAVAYFVNEYTFDFMSKRIQDTFKIKKYEKDLIQPALSVPTTFGETYLYLGWLGIIVYAVSMLLFPIVYFLAIRKFPLWELGIAVLCSIYFYSIFDNMFVFSGLSLQLFYPFFFFMGSRNPKAEIAEIVTIE